jgi:GNAT superfamily N-acetyltransferase
MDELKFRDAVVTDLSSIIALLADDELGQKRENIKKPLPSEYLYAFEGINQDVNQRLIVVTDEKNVIIGTLQLSFIQYLTYQGGIRAQIEAVRILKNQRGKGIGKRMFEWAIQVCKEKGAHLIQLTTDKKRPEAIQFYKDLGFDGSHEGMKLHLAIDI